MSWLKILGLLPFLISAALALICALSFKTWRKRIRRRSPLQGRKAGHLPGQQLLERVGHHHDELMTSVMLTKRGQRTYLFQTLMFSDPVLPASPPDQQVAGRLNSGVRAQQARIVAFG